MCIQTARSCNIRMPRTLGRCRCCSSIWSLATNTVPLSHRFFETFSFLPPLTDDQIAKQVDYMVANSEFACAPRARAPLSRFLRSPISLGDVELDHNSFSAAVDSAWFMILIFLPVNLQATPHASSSLTRPRPTSLTRTWDA